MDTFCTKYLPDTWPMDETYFAIGIITSWHMWISPSYLYQLLLDAKCDLWNTDRARMTGMLT